MTFKKIKILFIGTVNFSEKALCCLIENKFDVIGIITKKKSNYNSDFSDLSTLAKKNNIPLIYRYEKNIDDLINFIKKTNPDVIYCFGWSHILPSSILSIPKYGVVGFHPAELPNNRGRHPIIWALFLGLKETASTFFLMDESADTGDIISQEKIRIINDDAYSLYEKITKVALKQILIFTKELENKGLNISKIKQDKSIGNTWRKRNKNDGKIDFRMSNNAILNLVNALTKPYVGAYIEYLNEDVKIWKVKKEKYNKKNYEPGKVLDIEGNEIIVKTYDGAIRILLHEFVSLPKIGEYL